MENVTKVTVGRLVLYKLSADDVEVIRGIRRSYGLGNEVSEGDIYPALVVKVWENNMINCQVFLDGNDAFWQTSVQQGGDVRNWDWMPFQKDQQKRLAEGTPIDESMKTAE